MNQPVSPARCLGVAGGGDRVAGGAGGVPAARPRRRAVALRAGRSAPASFEELLVDGCAVAALLAATWLWAVTCAIALLAAPWPA